MRALNVLRSVLLLFVCARATVPAFAIYGGSTVAPCAWPSVVQLGECTGTLIHPRVVLYAAHCGEEIEDVVFGESIGAPARRVPVVACRSFPEGEEDFAYCLLAEAVDVPVVPIISARELAALWPGMPVTIAGFGLSEAHGFGEKRSAETVLGCLTPAGEARVGGSGVDACAGDSGGPAFVELSLGGERRWRLIGVASRGGACGQGGYYAIASRAIAWIEAASGVDVDGCRDRYGEWIGGPECGAVPATPQVGGGAWSGSCSAATVAAIDFAQAANEVAVDDDSPRLELVAEPRVVRHDLERRVAFVELDVDVSDVPGGCGLGTIEVLVDGQALAPIAAGARGATINVPFGAHELELRARDLAGNTSEPTSIRLDVDVEVMIGGGCAAMPGSASWEVCACIMLALIAIRMRRA